MRSWKSVLGVARALLPIGYFGYLLYYFLGVGGSMENAWDIGLGPTVLGLGVVVLLFCMPLAWKLMKMFSGPRWPRSGGRPGAPPGHGEDEDESGAAADAIVARYMAKRSAEAAAAPRPAPANGGPGGRSGLGRPTFGRKNS